MLQVTRKLLLALMLTPFGVCVGQNSYGVDLVSCAKGAMVISLKVAPEHFTLAETEKLARTTVDQHRSRCSIIRVVITTDEKIVRTVMVELYLEGGDPYPSVQRVSRTVETASIAD